MANGKGRVWLLVFTTLLVLLASARWGMAQEADGGETAGKPPKPSAQEFLATHQPPLPAAATSKAATPTIPEVWCADISDQTTREVCWQAYRASLGYYETGLAHRTRVFSWQHLSTRIIFFIVVGLVLVGIYFAWMQFRRDMVTGRQGSDVTNTAHEIELSASGIKVRSSVLGVIILALSLGFFYLYLVYVFPISEIF